MLRLIRQYTRQQYNALQNKGTSVSYYTRIIKSTIMHDVSTWCMMECDAMFKLESSATILPFSEGVTVGVLKIEHDDLSE